MEQKRGLYDELAAVVLPLPHRFFTSVIISVEKLVATSVPDSFQMIPLQEGLSVRRTMGQDVFVAAYSMYLQANTMTTHPLVPHGT